MLVGPLCADWTFCSLLLPWWFSFDDEFSRNNADTFTSLFSLEKEENVFVVAFCPAADGAKEWVECFCVVLTPRLRDHFFCTVLKTTRWKRKYIAQPQKQPDSPSGNTTSLVWVSGLTEDGMKNCNILLFLYRINGKSFPVVTPMMPSLFLARHCTCSWNKNGVDLCGEQQCLIAPSECWWPGGMTEWVVAAATALQREHVGGSEGNVN